MEQLAKTCKILYDQEFLDNQKLFKQGYSHNKILYENNEEYKKLCNEFKRELPILLEDNRIDDWDNVRNIDIEDEFCIRYECPLESVLEKALSTLSKHQNKKWVNDMIDILSCAVRGLANSINYMDIDKHIECEECGNEDNYINVQDNFKETKICNRMIVNVINGILFGEDARGYTFGGGDNCGQLAKISQFKCQNCGHFCDMVDRWDNKNEDEMCYECYEKIEEK
jgi:hypothetical protein